MYRSQVDGMRTPVAKPQPYKGRKLRLNTDKSYIIINLHSTLQLSFAGQDVLRLKFLGA